MKILSPLFSSLDRACKALDNSMRLAEVSTDVAARSVDNWGKIQNAQLLKDYEDAKKDLPKEVLDLLDEKEEE